MAGLTRVAHCAGDFVVGDGAEVRCRRREEVEEGKEEDVEEREWEGFPASLHCGRERER